jgi:hypothetical protein
MIVALIALAAFVVLLSIQVYFAQAEIKILKADYKTLKEYMLEELADARVRMRKLESEVKENG